MIGAVQNVYGNYVNFMDRASRSEYWFFVLFAVIASIILSGLDIFIGIYSFDVGMGLFSGIFSLVSLIPSIAVSVRRLHDTGSSGWWFLLIFLPVLGGIALLVWFIVPSNKGANKYGPEPEFFI